MKRGLSLTIIFIMMLLGFSATAYSEVVIVKTRERPFLIEMFDFDKPLQEAFKQNYARQVQIPEKFERTSLSKAAESVSQHHVLFAKDLDKARKLVDQLKGRGDVEYAYVEPRYEPAVIRPDDYEDAKPLSDELSQLNPDIIESYVHLQDYLFPAPIGVDATYAWTVAGGKGENVRIADIEGNWDILHDELKDNLQKIFDGMGDTEHGTACMGEMIGKADELGITGIVPESKAIGVSKATSDYPVIAEYMLFAASKLKAGDVMLLEMHESGPNSGGYPQAGYVPMEYFPLNFEAIKIITENGIHVVEAAGNGAENFDYPVYEKLFDRKERDSGAILVGAAAPPRENGYELAHLKRLPFSNHGAAVDAMGYGTAVTTTGYGDLHHRTEHNFYTADFGGTSSASPIVAGSVAALSSMAAQAGIEISPERMRRVIKASYTPEVHDDGIVGTIGGLPDIKKAWQLLGDSGIPIAEIEEPSQNKYVERDAAISFSAARKDGYVYRWTVRNLADSKNITSYSGEEVSHKFEENGHYTVELTVQNGGKTSLAPATREVVVDEKPKALTIDSSYEEWLGKLAPIIRFSEPNVATGDIFLELSRDEDFDKDSMAVNQRLFKEEMSSRKTVPSNWLIPAAGEYFVRMRIRSGLGDSPYSNVLKIKIEDEIGFETVAHEGLGTILDSNDEFTIIDGDSLIDGTQLVRSISAYNTKGILTDERISIANLKANFGTNMPIKAMIAGDLVISASRLQPLNIHAMPREATETLVEPVSKIHIGYSSDHILFHDDTLFVFSNEGMIILIDISNPIYPVITKKIEADTKGASFAGATVHEGKVYAAAGSELIEIKGDGSLSKIDIGMKSSEFTGIESVDGSIVLSSLHFDDDGKADAAFLFKWEGGAFEKLLDLPDNAIGLKAIYGRLYVIVRNGFHRVSRELSSIDGSHRSHTAYPPVPFGIDGKVISGQRSYVEYID